MSEDLNTTMQETIKSLSEKMLGYEGYMSKENRLFTFDVIGTHFDGRLQHKLSDFKTQYTVDSENPDHESLEKMHGEITDHLKKILPHTKFDQESLKPLFDEEKIHEETLLHDVVLLDKKIFQVEEILSMQLEGVTSLDLKKFQDCIQILERMYWLVQERTKRLNILNRLIHIIRKNADEFCKKIRSKSMTEKTAQGINTLLQKYPKRIETHEKILEAFRVAQPLYMNYENPQILLENYPLFKIYLESYSEVFKQLDSLLSDFTPSLPYEEKACEQLKVSIQDAPDFETLKNFLEDSYKDASKEKKPS